MEFEDYARVSFRLGLIHQYMHRALKHMNSLTPEEIEKMPPYVPHVLVKIMKDVERDADWFSDLKADLKQAALENATDKE